VVVLIPGAGRDVLAAPGEQFGQSTAESAAENGYIDLVRELALGFVLAGRAIGRAYGSVEARMGTK